MDNLCIQNNHEKDFCHHNFEKCTVSTLKCWFLVYLTRNETETILIKTNNNI